MEACLNYLATPFTRHPRGLDAAFREACFTAELVRRLGLDVYCPIEETFSVSKRTKIDPLDYEFWQAVIAPWIPRCDRILVAMIDGWEQSVGIEHERREFRRLGKPELLIHPFTLRPL